MYWFIVWCLLFVCLLIVCWLLLLLLLPAILLSVLLLLPLSVVFVGVAAPGFDPVMGTGSGGGGDGGAGSGVSKRLLFTAIVHSCSVFAFVFGYLCCLYVCDPSILHQLVYEHGC